MANPAAAYIEKLGKRFIAHVHEIVIAVAVDFDRFHIAGILALAGFVLIAIAVELFLKAGD